MDRFGPLFAGDIRRQRVSSMRRFRQWRWHLDEMYVKMSGEMRYLWRAVDHEGEILESFFTRERDKAATLHRRSAFLQASHDRTREQRQAGGWTLGRSRTRICHSDHQNGRC